jgi:hypothetical protein
VPEERTRASTSQDAVASVATAGDRLVRTARALLGWLPEPLALRLMNSNDAMRAPTDDQRAAAASARAAVAARHEGLDQTDLVRDLPAGVLTNHLALLAQVPDAADFFNEGWRVALVDLSRVCGFQPTVFTDSAAERAAGVDPADVEQLAAVTLPTQFNPELNAQLDEARNQFLLVSRNPNLRLAGHFAGPLQPNSPPAFGFLATIRPSFLQVAGYGGRYFLRDGYHRSLGLLGIGATWVPAFVRDLDAIQELVPPGMLPQEAFVGARPPKLLDYSDDAVSASVQLPASQKMIVVQALELSPLG